MSLEVGESWGAGAWVMGKQEREQLLGMHGEVCQLVGSSSKREGRSNGGILIEVTHEAVQVAALIPE